jgi:uncharacterized protein YfdQ (DUF2303 family)
MSEDHNNMQAVIDAARQGAKPETVADEHGVKWVLVPGVGAIPSKIEKVSIRSEAPHPYRKVGAVQVFDAVSLNKIMAENIGGNITVYVDRSPAKPAIVAVLNGHGAGGPGWADHRASVAFRPTPQWVKWTGIDGKFLSQADFANFIEDNLLDVKVPEAGNMLEISQFLEVTRTTTVKSVSRPKSGLVQFKNENNDAVVGEQEIPDTLTLWLAPMVGTSEMEVAARFRYRIDNGTLKLGVKLQRVEEIMATILEDFVSLIQLPDGAVMVEGVAP